MAENLDQNPDNKEIDEKIDKEITILEKWLEDNDIDDNREQISYFRKRYNELKNEKIDTVSKPLLIEAMNKFMSDNEITKGGRRRSSTARKSSSRRRHCSSKKRGTQRKQKRRQRRGSRRAY